MKFIKILSLTLMVLAAVSCSTPKEISYFQDLQPGVTELAITDPVEIKVRPKDKLSILVNAQDPKLTNMFNLPIVSQQIGQESTGSSGIIRGVSGYTVDSFGDINFPVLGKIRVEGMTREQIADYLTKQLKEQELIKDPVVTVEFMNLGVSVLGEVNKPGRISINRDNMTILDALSEAGDLTIFGKREKVLVLRQEDGKQRVYGVNLCSADHIYTSPVYYLQQNDVVYVIPNDTKSRQSTVNGNTVRSTSFWISLASLITSIAVLIVK
ncbi:BexD/CtrA/VexA family polysaccharide export protein [Prevotella sp. P5-126]|uniref:polysaccharide biosynthesis/export family protein n=1 Tax=Prevotella sp. P5-126 TaxID=2024216 RepID=UPI000B972208|nr:polysaccharide biosynthesis/export family protein [Prevotella sp. P5-126]OYP38469.1 BexD/CtrA/VexA family polysaccharide export protein [Prevotella sp. P5-126]